MDATLQKEVKDLIDQALQDHEQRAHTGRKLGRFIEPTATEVKVFALEQGVVFDGDEWVDSYKTKGWKISSGCPMVDWRAAVRRAIRTGWCVKARVPPKVHEPTGLELTDKPRIKAWLLEQDDERLQEIRQNPYLAMYTRIIDEILAGRKAT